MRNIKKLVKKYPSLKTDLQTLQEELAKNPTLGAPLGNDAYKIRMAIASKGKGKSGGARVITYVIEKIENVFKVYLLSIYDKSDVENIDANIVKELIEEAKLQDEDQNE